MVVALTILDVILAVVVGTKARTMQHAAFSATIYTCIQCSTRDELCTVTPFAAMAALTRSMCPPCFVQVALIQCGEPLRPGLLDALGIGSRARAFWAAATGGGQPDIYSVTSHATQALLDELEYRTMMARYGM